MRRFMYVWPLATVCLVTACAPATPPEDATTGTPVAGNPPVAANAPGAGYRAGGNEPFWTLTFSDDMMDFADMGASTKAGATRPAAEPMTDGWRFRATSDTRPFVVEIRDVKCSDSMSGMPFPHTVSVRIGDATYSGCGGRTMDLLTTGEWQVVELDGSATTAARQPTLTFAADSTLTGTGGCNRYRAMWKLSGEGLDIGPAAATKMACAEDGIGRQESRFFELLDRVSRFDIAADGRIVLYAMDRPVITARPVQP